MTSRRNARMPASSHVPESGPWRSVSVREGACRNRSRAESPRYGRNANLIQVASGGIGMSVAQPVKLNSRRRAPRTANVWSISCRTGSAASASNWPMSPATCRRSPAAYPASPSGSGICKRPPRRWCGQSRHRQRLAVGAVGDFGRGRRNHPVARRGGDRGPAYRRIGRSRRPHRKPARLGRYRAVASGQGIRLDRGDRQANQPAGAERDHRGRPRRRRRAEVLRWLRAK